MSGGAISFGSNYSDPAPEQAFASLVSGAQRSTGVKAAGGTVDRGTFQNDITAYLQGTPNDLVTWFAGYRMQYFAAQGLLEPADDVWAKIGGNFDAATTSLCQGLDGHYYFVPACNYPWVVFCSKSTFASKGYAVPATWDQLIALCKAVKKDGLVLFAFADKDRWPALGTFGILNLRVNGRDYHSSLMHNQAHWTGPQVTAVSGQWRELVPCRQSGANGRIWEGGSKALEGKRAGMMFQGTNQIAANYVSGNKDAPTDGLVLPAKAGNKDAAKAVLEYIGTGPAKSAYLKYDEWDVGLVNGLQHGHRAQHEREPGRLARQPQAEPAGGAGRGVLAAGRVRDGAVPGGPEGGRPVPAGGGARGRREHHRRGFPDRLRLGPGRRLAGGPAGAHLRLPLPGIRTGASLMPRRAGRAAYGLMTGASALRVNVFLLLLFTAADLLPQQVIITPLYRLCLLTPLPGLISSSGLLYDSTAGLVVINAAFQTGFCVFVLGSYMRTMPAEMHEAAQADGASMWSRYWRLTLPLCRPALAALANLQGQFVSNQNLIAAAAVMAAVPALIVYPLLQKQFIAGLTLGAAKG